MLLGGNLHIAIAGNHVTFPGNAPGAQPDKVAAPAPRHAGAAPAGAAGGDGAAAPAPMFINHVTPGRIFKHFIVGERNIFFRRDGKQPTTQQAAAWSCANINNNNITRWYLRMFGCTDPAFVGPGVVSVENGFAPLSAGASSPERQTPSRIITFTNLSPIQEKQFWHEFSKIASNPVGRVLLYRLLIEIRRENGGNGCEEQGPNVDPSVDVQRNNARCLVVGHGDSEKDWHYMPTYDGKSPIMSVNFSRVLKFDTLATSPSEANPAAPGTCHTKDVPHGSIVCALFHEMLHWYQQLRNQERSNSEYRKPYDQIANNDLSIDLGYRPIPANVPHFESWVKSYVELDEMRVICGAGNILGHVCHYMEGDDLSENAFRCAMGLKMRFGHGDKIPVANNEVDKAIEKAHAFALDCVSDITGAAPPNWGLTRGQALHR